MRILVILGALGALYATHARADVFTITAPTQTVDGQPFDPSKIKAEHLVCTGPTAIDTRVILPATSYTATLAPGNYVCKLQTIAAYDCSLTGPDGATWQYGPGDSMGPAMMRDGVDTGGRGPVLAIANGAMYAIGTDNNWYSWTVTDGWTRLSAQPAGTDPALEIMAPAVLGECASDYTPDLSFTIPLPKAHRLRPRAGGFLRR